MKKWRILRANAEFVAKMEGIQDAYQRPYDPIVPVVCIDETSKQLIQQTRILCELGQPEKVDYEFVRKGVTKIFMICEPLVGRRQLWQKRTTVDFAEIFRYVSDQLYLSAEKIILITDNLSIHAPTSLYKALPPQQAYRLAGRFEWHYKTKCGSWLDVVEIEIGILSLQAMDNSLSDIYSLQQQVRAWTVGNNARSIKVKWPVKSRHVRIKLVKIYPIIVWELTRYGTSDGFLDLIILIMDAIVLKFHSE